MFSFKICSLYDIRACWKSFLEWNQQHKKFPWFCFRNQRLRSRSW